MPPSKIAILGGGISGLACAHRLWELKEKNKADFEIQLFEAAQRLGGTIETEHRDGFILEKGPDSFLSEKPAVIDLAKRLGLESEIVGTSRENRKSFVLRNKKLVPIPEGFYMIAPTVIGPFLKTPLFSPLGKLRMMFEPFIPADKKSGDESVAGFIRRRFGREALERVGQAMVAGIYTGDPERLSVRAALPRFKEMEEKHGSVVKGLLSRKKNGTETKASGPRYSLFLSFRDGMETLPKKIAGRLPSGTLKTGAAIREVSYDPLRKKWTLVESSGQIRTADALCCSLSADRAGEIFKNSIPRLSEKLGQVNFESVLTLNLAFRRSSIRHALDGFGFVVPKLENSPIVACSFSSQKFVARAPQDSALLRVFVGGAFGREWFEKDDKDLVPLVQKELAQVLGISGAPLFSVIRRYPRSMVQYEVGHARWLAEIELELEKSPRLYLTGSSYRGVGIPDAVCDAEFQAERIYSHSREGGNRP